MRRLMARVQEAAESPSSVLVVGESGTGKELIARALHDQSPRADKAFVTMDCTGLPPTIIGSELFGHEKGAFTGAHKRHIGAFERAHGGTIFLDEIGELPEAVQSSLLGVLERKRFRRVGGEEEVSVDVRVVAATNRELRSEVNAGNFRLDLYYRLAVVVLEVPPLRERVEDLAILVEHFLHEMGYQGAVEDLIGPKSLKAMKRHRWPGNVRELRNLVEATIAVGTAPQLHAPHQAKTEGADDLISGVLEEPYRQARRVVLDEFELRYLRALLERTEGNVSKAARIAKMDRSYLIDLIRRHKLKD